MPALTLATRITILRILLIPVFALLMLYYEAGFGAAARDESLRLWAAAVFLLAAISDGVDGFIARHFNQRSRLGKILDPIADKGLLITALLVLSWSHVEEPWRLPLWFPILLISRDVIVVIGAVIIHYVHGNVEVRARWPGKFATALTMIALTAALLRPAWFPFQPAIFAAGIFTAISFVLYIFDGVRQLNAPSTQTR